MEIKDTAAYVLYRNGRAVLVSREEWEQSWLDWWLRINNYRDLD